MAFTIVTHRRTNESNANSTTVAVTLLAAAAVGDYIDVAVGWGASATEHPTCADNLGGGASANVYSEQTACNTRNVPNSQANTRFTCPVTQAGTPTITVTFAGSRQYRSIEATVIRGAASVDKSTGLLTTATTTPSSGSVTPDTDGELCLSVVNETSTGVQTITPSVTVINNNGPTDGYCSQYEVQAVAGAIAGTFTFASAQTGQVSLITYRPAGGSTPVSQTGAAPWEARGYLPKAQTGPWESRRAIAQTRTGPWEARLSILQARSPAWESRLGVRQTQADPWESGRGLRPSIVGIWESILPVASARPDLWESRLGLSQTSLAAWESLLGVLQGRLDAWESLQGLHPTLAAPWESLGLLAVSQTVVVPWESIQALAATTAPNWESIQPVLQARPSPWENSLGVRLAVAVPWEALKGLSPSQAALWESLGLLAVSQTKVSPWESLQGLPSSRVALWESLGLAGPLLPPVLVVVDHSGHVYVVSHRSGARYGAADHSHPRLEVT